ncbi:MAG: amino acid kinase [Methanosarcinales archaeon]|nr:amino acid kinase [Methanosarcinales archaeon]MCK4652057.1 amino acid kinase [Methanosarcinales archaeon]MCK4810854.1 amino acid kinase [Methanosarcinales archaeon]
MIVIKIGGSLIGNARNLVYRLHEYALTKDERILIVPGGGIFADTVRMASGVYGISDEAAHWMAILAMDQYAHYLTDGTPARLVIGIADLSSIRAGASVLLVYNLLKKSDSENGSGIAHTWNATSDTIAGWIASQLDATFIKATDVDGILRDGEQLSEITASELITMGETCVDPELPGLLLSRSLNCRVVNGKNPDHVIDAIKKVSRGTLIIGQ